MSLYFLFILPLWLLICILVLYIRYQADLKRIIQEPALKYPVVIFESDDWGVGPLGQQDALEQIRNLFFRFKDELGHHPVMTLGLVLAEPDEKQINIADVDSYQRRTLNDPIYKPILTSLQIGVDQGIFSIQLHGMEHYWPPSIMRSLPYNNKIQQWLFNKNDRRTEDLPSELQSRWVDSSQLPSGEHTENEIETAINEELTLYQTLFLQPARTVVPPTFVWTNVVEETYARHGIQTLITPGRQCTGRDNKGKLIRNNRYFYNGEEKQNLLFIVRDNYFEPSLGHTAEMVFPGIVEKINSGRPALLEMHRLNFINEIENNINSLHELEKLLQLIQSKFNHIRFISTEQLAQVYRDHNRNIDSDFIISSPIQRLKFILARIKLSFKFNRFAKFSGINLLLRWA